MIVINILPDEQITNDTTVAGTVNISQERADELAELMKLFCSAESKRATESDDEDGLTSEAFFRKISEVANNIEEVAFLCFTSGIFVERFLNNN